MEICNKKRFCENKKVTDGSCDHLFPDNFFNLCKFHKKINMI